MGDQKSLTDKQIRAAKKQAALAVFEEQLSALVALGIADRDAREAPEVRSAAADKAQQIRADAEVRAQEIRDAAERKAQEAIAAADQKAREVEDDAEVEVDRRFEEWQSRVKHAMSVGLEQEAAGREHRPDTNAQSAQTPWPQGTHVRIRHRRGRGRRFPASTRDLPEAAIATPAAVPDTIPPDTVVPYSA